VKPIWPKRAVICIQMYGNDKRRARLAQFDLSAGEIARLHGPVGLAIGSRTPPEIAVAILAELISVRNHRTGSTVSGPPQEICA
jgi:xanthine dehydrogenase accessory factor